MMGCIRALVVGGLAVVLVGCADSSPKTPERHPGDEILKDPMGYKPNMDSPDISGGGTLDFNKKAFNKDVHDFLNP